MRSRLLLFTLAWAISDPLIVFAEGSNENERRQLRQLYEACRTRTFLVGAFPRGYRDLEGFVNPELIRQYPAGVEFRDPESETNRNLKLSPVGKRSPCLRLRVEKGRWLNVAMTGWIYESELYWESEFLELMPRPFMAPEELKKDRRPIPERAAERSPRCGPNQVNLALRCNALPSVPWIVGPKMEQGKPPGFSEWLKDGIYEHNSILFDARGVIQVDGLVTKEGEGIRNIPGYPKAVRDIPVGRHVRSLHLLTGVVDRADVGTVVAFIRFRFVTGEIEEFPLRYGIHVAAADDQWSGSGRLYPVHAGDPGYYPLHYVSFECSNPADEVQSFDFISGNSTSQPFLVAMTVTQ
jgi:hypothetical protein